jgi:Fic family protein
MRYAMELMSSGFSAHYRRYTPALLDSLMRISAALGTIRGARVLPAVADQLRVSAKAGTVHYSNLIEGNQLPFIEAERATRGELSADTRAKIELVNYVAALDLIDSRLADGALDLTPGFLKELHATAMRGLGREGDPHFQPHHEGEWRDGVAVVVDRMTNEVMHEGPPKEGVPELMDAMFGWLTRKLDAEGEPPFVLAGVIHYGITDVHPFADGNGRAARLFQTALLMKADVLPGRMFSFEGYYAEDQGAYYEALRSVRRNTLNMESWLEYFLHGLVEEYERVAATVADLSSLVSAGGKKPLRLTSNQEQALAALRIQGRREFSRRDYEQAGGVARTAANEEIRALIRHGVLVARGAGASTRYAFTASEPSEGRRPRRGRKAKWNDVAIERELREFLDGRSAWPTRQEFLTAGKGDVYSAASRAGGIARWRRFFGL